MRTDGETYNLVEALGSTQTRGAHADNEDIDVAVALTVVSKHTSNIALQTSRDTAEWKTVQSAVYLHVSHFECLQEVITRRL